MRLVDVYRALRSKAVLRAHPDRRVDLCAGVFIGMGAAQGIVGCGIMIIEPEICLVHGLAMVVAAAGQFAVGAAMFALGTPDDCPTPPLNCAELSVRDRWVLFGRVQ